MKEKLLIEKVDCLKRILDNVYMTLVLQKMAIVQGDKEVTLQINQELIDFINEIQDIDNMQL